MKISPRPPGMCIRICAVLTFYPFLHRVEKDFPSHALLQGFTASQHEAIPALESNPQLGPVLIKLMDHNIAHNPSAWTSDLWLLTQVPQGIAYLNNLPLEVARRADWRYLESNWNYFQLAALSGFKLTLLKLCDSVPKLLSYFTLLTDSDFACILFVKSILPL